MPFRAKDKNKGRFVESSKALVFSGWDLFFDLRIENAGDQYDYFVVILIAYLLTESTHF